MNKPQVNLIGQDGNAFYIIGACMRAARKAGWDKDKIDVIVAEMKSGDYENLLFVAKKYFEII